MKKPVLIFIGMALLTAALLSRPGFRIKHAAEDTSKRKITWIIPLDLDREKYEAIIEDFHKQHPDIKLEPQWVPSSQFQTKFKTLVAAGMPPDIFYCGDVWVAYLRPFLMDISPLIERDKAEMDFDDFYPRLRKAALYEGKYYFLPRSFNISLLYYNKKLFDQAGIPYPNKKWTWKDYTEAGKKISELTVDGKKAYGSTIMVGWWGEWLTMVRQAGGRMFNKEITECMLDRPEAIMAMKFYSDKIKLGISPAPGKGPSRGFEGGRYGMVWGGHTGNWKIYNEMKDLDWDIEMLPIGPVRRNGAELAMDAYGISKDCKDPEAAWTVLKFLTSKESLERFARSGQLVARKSVAEKVFINNRQKGRPQNIGAVYESLDYAMSIPQSPDFIELSLEVIQPEIDLMTAEGMNVEKVCKEATKAANAFIKTMGTEDK